LPASESSAKQPQEPQAPAPGASADKPPQANVPAANTPADAPARSAAAAPQVAASPSPATSGSTLTATSSPAGTPPSPAAADPTPQPTAPASSTTPFAADPAPTAATPQAAEAKQPTAQLSIVGDKKHGVILTATSVAFKDGDTVFDLLQKTTKQHKIQMEYSGRGATIYIEGIDNLYEFDEGPKSGWVFKLNGKLMTRGAGSSKLAAGDKIEWLYTLDLGKDVEETAQ
jgi:hypothetical protein